MTSQVQLLILHLSASSQRTPGFGYPHGLLSGIAQLLNLQSREVVSFVKLGRCCS